MEIAPFRALYLRAYEKASSLYRGRIRSCHVKIDFYAYRNGEINNETDKGKCGCVYMYQIGYTVPDWGYTHQTEDLFPLSNARGGTKSHLCACAHRVCSARASVQAVRCQVASVYKLRMALTKYVIAAAIAMSATALPISQIWRKGGRLL